LLHGKEGKIDYFFPKALKGPVVVEELTIPLNYTSKMQLGDKSWVMVVMNKP